MYREASPVHYPAKESATDFIKTFPVTTTSKCSKLLLNTINNKITDLIGDNKVGDLI